MLVCTTRLHVDLPTASFWYCPEYQGGRQYYVDVGDYWGLIVSFSEGPYPLGTESACKHHINWRNVLLPQACDVKLLQLCYVFAQSRFQC